MSEQKNNLEEMMSELKQQRDELRLQMHLASMEAKDEYERLSDKCDELSKRYEPLSSAVAKTADNVFSALGLVADELKVGFHRVKKALTEDK